jgi:hypothetical protein
MVWGLWRAGGPFVGAGLGLSQIVLDIAATVAAQQVRDSAVRTLYGRGEFRERGRRGRIRGAALVVLVVDRGRI